MIKRILFYAIILTNFISCNAEKVNLSPVSGFNTPDRYRNTSFTERADQINYAAEITNLTSTIPKFKNEAVNKEVENLKIYLKEYIGSIDNYNILAREKSHSKYQKSYKNLQKLKTFLKGDEVSVLNRYLVRIKTNMETLEDQLKRETVIIND